MEQPNDIYSSTPLTQYDKFDDDNSSFDLMMWVMKFVHYWYLFLISVVVAFGISYLQNRKWQPTYKTSAQMMIEEGRSSVYGGGLGAGFMQGFGVQAGYRNVNNQIIMFGSRDLVGNVVDKMGLNIDAYTRGRFKTNNLYKLEPVIINQIGLSPEAFAYEYTIYDKNDGYRITWERGDANFAVEGKYNVPVKNKLFYLLITKTDLYRPGYKFYFRFRDRQSFIDDFSSRLSFDFVMKGASVISVSLVGLVAERDIDFINTLCETYLDENLDRKNEVASKTISFIDDQMAGIADSLNISEGRLKSFRVNNQIVDVSSLTGQLLTDYRKLEADQSAFKLKMSYFNYLTDYLKKNIQDEIIVVPTTMGVSDPALIPLVNTINDLQNKKREVGPKNPYYQKYNQEIVRVKASLLEVLDNIKASLNIEKRELDKNQKEISERLSRLPDQESLMSKYQRRFKIHDDYYTYLLQKRAESEIQKASNSPDNVLLEKARITGVTNGGVQQKTRSMYLVIAFLLPFAFVLIKEFLNNKIND